MTDGIHAAPVIDLSDADLLNRYEQASKQVGKIRLACPTVTFVPNRVQKKILKLLDEGIKEGCRSYGIIPANGVGKSCLLVNLIWNIAAGPQNKYFDLPFIQKWPFRKELRIICNALEVKEGTGSLWKAFRDWWPRGEYRCQKQGFDYDALYELPNGFTLSIRTFNQPWAAHESDTLGAVFESEAPEEPNIWRQYGARLRGEGFRSLWSTIWRTGQLWVQEEILENPNARHCFGDIHECCRDCFPDGHMSHEAIEAVIADYNEDEREARRSGLLGSITSKVFLIKPTAHFYDHEDPEDLTAYSSLDPHPHKPWVYLTGGLDTHGDWWILDEWPHELYHKIKSDHRGIAEYAKIIKDNDARWQVVDRVIDRAGSGQQIRREYGSTTVREELDGFHKIRFRDGNRRVQDDGGDIGGITIVKSLLRHDPEQGYHAKLHIASRCKNLRYQLQHLCKKRDASGQLTGDLDDEFLDFPRALMYLVMAGFKHRTGISADDTMRNKQDARERELNRIVRQRETMTETVTSEAIKWGNY